MTEGDGDPNHKNYVQWNKAANTFKPAWSQKGYTRMLTQCLADRDARSGEWFHNRAEEAYPYGHSDVYEGKLHFPPMIPRIVLKDAEPGIKTGVVLQFKDAHIVDAVFRAVTKSGEEGTMFNPHLLPQMDFMAAICDMLACKWHDSPVPYAYKS